MKIQALQTTPNSWIVQNENGLAGLLSKQDERYDYYTPHGIYVFQSEGHMRVELRGIKFIQERDIAKEKLEYINGYPVRHHDVVIVDEGDIPLYTKGGNTIYAAGFWAIKFNTGWTQAYCPKATTVTDNECQGPFKTKIELLGVINRLNKRAQG